MKQTGIGKTLRAIRFALSWSGFLIVALIPLTISPVRAASVAGPSITITCMPPNGPTTYGENFTQTCTADQSGPYNWQAPELPSGLSLTSNGSNTVTISGVPNQLGSYYYQLYVYGLCDSGGSLVSCSGLLVFQGSIVQAPLSADCFPMTGDATYGQSYTVTCTAHGALLSYLWDFQNLPKWIPTPTIQELGQKVVVLTGTPDTLGTTGFTATVSAPMEVPVQLPVTINVHENLTLSCNAAAGPVNQLVSSTCQIRGGAPPYSYTSSALPSGFMLDPTTGAISGMSPTPLYSQVNVTATDSSYPTAATHTTVTIINIKAVGLSLTCMNIQADFGATIATTPCTASAGTPPYGYSSTQLPSGLMLDSATGKISGTTSAAGTFPITMTVHDSASGTAAVATATFSIIVNAQMLSLSCSDLSGTSGKPLSATPCSAMGGTAPFQYQATGLPGGLVMNASSGMVSGSTGTLGSFTVSVTVTDNGQQSAMGSFMVVIGQPPLTLSCTNKTVNVGDSASFTPCSASGGHSPYSYSATGLPIDLSMDTSGKVTGTVSSEMNTFSVNVTVMDTPSNGQPAQAMASFQIDVHLVVPPVHVDISGANGPSSHPTIDLNLGNASPATLNGMLEVTFESAVGNVPSGYIDPGVQFPNGMQKLAFTVSAGETLAQFANPAMFSPGTVAGTLHFKVVELTQDGADVLPNPAPETTYEVPLMAPVITPGSVKITSSTTGISVQLQAYSDTRELGRATLQFNAATGSNLGGNTTATVVLAEQAATYFEGDTGLANGSRFQLTLDFGYAGEIAALGGVTVTLTNNQGTSEAVTGTR